MRQNKVDYDDIEASPLEQLQLETIQESQNMPIELIHEEIKKCLKEAPNRKNIQLDKDILQNHKFDVEEPYLDQKYDNLVDYYNKIPKDRFETQDILELIQDFQPSEQDILVFCEQNRIKFNQDMIISNQSLSEVVQIHKTNEVYLIHYKLSIISQCFIFKFNGDKFELEFFFLADFNTKGEQTSIFNKVFINENGIYFLNKNWLANQIKVNHVQNQKSGFDELRENNQLNQNKKQSQEILNITLDDATELEHLDIGFAKQVSQEVEIKDMFVVIYQYEYVLKKQLMIYSLKNIEQPAIIYHTPSLQKLDKAFVVKQNDDFTYFILKSREIHIQIKWMGLNLLKIDNQSQKDCVQQKDININDRIYDQQIIVENFQVNIKESEYVDQFYYVDCMGGVDLIFPFQQDESIEKNITDFIQEHHKIAKGFYSWIFAFLSKHGNKYQNFNQEMLDFLREKGSPSTQNYYPTLRVFLNDMILTLNSAHQSVLHALILKKDPLLNTTNQQCRLLKSNQHFLYNQIQQYSFNQSQDSKDMTMIKSKKLVALNNNMLIIKDKKFVIDENNLFIINENNSQPDVLILKLFAPQVECKGSFGQRISELTKYHFSNNHAIFFFQARGSGQGQIFFVLISLQELYLLIQQNKYLINEGTDVFIMEKLDSIKKEQFNREAINQMNCNDTIYYNQTQIELLFEANRDLADPTKDQFPFLLYQAVNNKYEIFFCFINVEEVGKQLIHKKNKEKIVQVDKFIQSFKIHQHYGWDELTLYKEHDKQRQYFVGYQNKTNMFCRSSNWEYIKEKNQYQAKYQIGFNILINNYSAIQVRDHLVEINSEQKIQIIPIKMQYVSFNQNYTQDILRIKFDSNLSINNQRFISKIDDDGNIDGSMLIFNHKKSNEGIWKITNDIKILNKYFSKETADELADSLFFVTQVVYQEGQVFQGYSCQGKYHEINQELLVNQISECAKIYDIIDLADNHQKHYNTIVNKMCKMTIQKNKYLSISTVVLNHKCFDSYFEQNQLLYWLFYFQKNLICARQIQFNDLSLVNLNYIDQNYLQPCIILEGQNHFYSNRKLIDVTQLNSLISLQQNKNFYLSNSIIEQASQSTNELLIQSFEINHFYDYQADPFKKLSITQCLIDGKKIIEVVYFFTKTVKNNPSQQTLNMLIQDLPMLMEFQKVDFNQFFNLSQEEESSISDIIDFKNEKLSNIVQCNLEQIIKDNRLKILGSEEQIVYSPQNFDGVHFSKDQMINILMNIDRPDSEDCQVQYSYICFNEMIRKIQIDLFFNRDTQFCEYLQQFASLKNIKCSHMILAHMINKCKEVPNFFEQSTTQNIIDIQFKYTREEIKKYLFIYALGFFIPYVHNSLALIAIENISEESSIHFSLRWILYLICLITQAYFLMLELPEIYYKSFGNYISEIYNFFDISLPMLFILHLSIRAIWKKVTDLGWMQLFDIIVELLIITGSTIKILQYIRYKEEYSYFVQMFFSVLTELGPFLLVFLIFIMVFFVFQIILGAQVPDEGSDYPGAHPYVRMLFHVFRTSVGDLQVLDYSKWADDPSVEKTTFTSVVRTIILGLVWTFWIFDIYLILIVMLNLLIAQVGQIYEKIMSQGQTSIYKERAELNLKVFQTKYFFGEKHEFVALIMQTPMQGSNSFNFDDFITFTERVKKTTQFTVDRMENRMKNNIKSLENNVNLMKNKLESKIDIKIGNLESNINLIKDQMGSVQKLMEQFVQDQKILVNKF